jgi:exopolyphosphatase / guanosine-5'-triphosphate,3'-diphosphate pyrophosphatase
VSVIVPRWEWRTFGRRFGAAETAFAAMTSTGTQDSDELYLISEDGDTVKIRGGLLDIKRLREVDADGLQRWEPVLKAEFPISTSDVASVFEALRSPLPALERESYTLDQFLEEVVGPEGPVRSVAVHKHRVRYTVNGCTSEVTDAVIDGRDVRTIAIESPDAAAVVEAVSQVGLEGFVNTSYPKGIAAVLDGRPPRYAVIDVGTNSVKFHVAERDESKAWRRVVDRAVVTRLGEGMVDGGDIGDGPRDRTATAITEMVREAMDLDVVAIAAVGTAGLRAAGNSSEVTDAFHARAGVTVTTITGEEEGRLAYLAAIQRNGHPEGSVAVFDTGGGSSQFTFGSDTRVDERFSLPVGAVRYTERFGLGSAVTADVLAEARAAIDADLARIDGRPAPDRLIAMGGVVTNLAAIKLGLATYDPDVVNKSTLDRDEIDRQIETFRAQDADARRTIVGMQPARADVILAGACIVRAVMDKLGQDALTVCDRGLRHGLLDERFGAASGVE